MDAARRRDEAMPQTGVLHNETERGNLGKDGDFNRERSLNDHTASDPSAQAGVRRIEAVSKAWTKSSLMIAYVTYVLLSTSCSHIERGLY